MATLLSLILNFTIILFVHDILYYMYPYYFNVKFKTRRELLKSLRNRNNGFIKQ